MPVKFTLQPIECGTVTCYSQNNKRLCRYVYTFKFGMKWKCHLFDQELFDDEKGRFLLRCKDCLQAEEWCNSQEAAKIPDLR